MFTIRGATTIEIDNRDEVLDSAEELIHRIIESNNIDMKDIISVIFSCTDDIKSVYPAEAARRIGITKAGLFCLQEMDVTGSLRKCIRVLMFVNRDISQEEIKHIYLKNASNLRRDL